MRVRAFFALLALTVVLGACGGSAPEASKTAVAQPSAAAPPAPTVPAATAAKAPLAAPTTLPGQAPSQQPAGAPRTTPAAPATTSSTTARPVGATTAAPKAPRGTAAWAPSSPQPTPSQAAWALLDAWVANNRATALEDASPAAVSVLFSYGYPEAGVQYRGCSSPPGDTASSCAYRDGNDLLSLTVSLFPRGWAVTGAVLES
jgi:hypothetical protein